MRMVLGPLRTNRRPIQGLDGVRMQARVSVPERGFAEEGEVLFRTYGISGIVVFDASRHAQPGDAVVLDLAPAWEPDQLERLLQARAASLSFEPASTPASPGCAASTPATPGCAASPRASQPGRAFSGPLLSDVLRGMVDPPVAAAVCRMAGEDPAAAATPARCQAVARAFKGFRLQCEGVAEDQPCQVMRGGCAVEGVDPATLETLEQPRLYVLGEALDVDAPCGGFNLDWAWTCGIVAGHAVARHVAADDERTRL